MFAVERLAVVGGGRVVVLDAIVARACELKVAFARCFNVQGDRPCL
jgi:hypothetical protein